MTSSALRVCALAVAACAVTACGKKGPPQPPLRPVPAAVSDLGAERLGDAVTLTFTVPAANLDGSTPPATDRIEIYALTPPSAAASPPAPAELTTSANLAATVRVRAADDPPPGERPETRPARGDAVTHVDTAPAVEGAALTRYYAAVAFAGRRRGPASSILAVPLSQGPAPPAGVTADYSETTLKLIWEAGAPTQKFVVEETKTAESRSTRLTPAPLSAPEFTMPVEFERERCFVVRAVETTGAVALVGAAGPPVCVTPVDRFPPPPPTGLLAAASDGAVDLEWTASGAADVAGYVVLRAEGASGTLQRLTPALLPATKYRDETVQSGVTYVYAVLAVDRATPPNESEPSSRQTVTARRP